MKLIGIAGRSGSGKNTVAGFLAANLVEQGHRVAMDCIAGHAKRWARENLGWHGERTPFIRDFLQKYGAAVRDSHCQIEWLSRVINVWDPRFAAISDEVIREFIGEPSFNSPDYLIIPDIRTPEEAEVIHQYPHSALWLVTRDGAKTPLTAEQRADATEAGVDCIPADIVALRIKNEKLTLSELSSYIHKVVYEGRLIP